MKTQFIDKLVGQHWGIPRARGRALIGSIIQRIRGERPAEDKYGDPLPKMTVVDGTAFVPVYGAMVLDLPDWVKEWRFGLVDINDIAEELLQATNDFRIERIVLAFEDGW